MRLSRIPFRELPEEQLGKNPGNLPLALARSSPIGPATKAFLAAVAKHRNWDRAIDPPPV